MCEIEELIYSIYYKSPTCFYAYFCVPTKYANVAHFCETFFAPLPFTLDERCKRSLLGVQRGVVERIETER